MIGPGIGVGLFRLADLLEQANDGGGIVVGLQRTLICPPTRTRQAAIIGAAGAQPGSRCRWASYPQKSGQPLRRL